MKRRFFSLLLCLGLFCSLLPAASAQGETASVTALCVAESGGCAFLDAEEFQLLCRQATGYELESVTFSPLSPSVGSLLCKKEPVSAGTVYYPYDSPQISQISFTPYTYLSASPFTGQAEVSFTMTNRKDETIPGKLILYVPEKSEEPIELPYGMEKKSSAQAGEPLLLTELLPADVQYQLKGHSGAISSAPLISGVFELPPSDQGSLWLDYGYSDARKLLPGEVLFRDQKPNFYNVTFVPAGEDTSQVRLEYTASCEARKDVPGALILSFTKKSASRPAAVPDTPPAAADREYPADLFFTDMAGWEWAGAAAEFLWGKGYGSGSRFRPGDSATRGEVICALVKAAYDGEGGYPAPFSDLPEDKALFEAVGVAVKHGVVLGDGEGRLLPEAQVTRQDALVMVYRALMDQKKLSSLSRDLSGFSDIDELASYAREAAEALYAQGILQGNDAGRLEPRSPITRAEMACLLHRAFS